MPRFQSLVSCEDNFRRQIQEVRDKNHPRLQVSIEPQCMACRENNIVSVERHDNVKVLRVTGLLEDHVTCEVNENETSPSMFCGYLMTCQWRAMCKDSKRRYLEYFCRDVQDDAQGHGMSQNMPLFSLRSMSRRRMTESRC